MTELPKRFYKVVSISEDKRILLDGRAVKTPMKAVLQLPGYALAQAIAAEWEAQGKHIVPSSMPLTRFANTAIDRAESERPSVVAEIASYAGSDLVCYRAASPAALVGLQAEHWDPTIVFAKDALGARFNAVTGVMHSAQSPEALDVIRAVATDLDGFRLTALFNLTTLTGSALLSLMLLRKALAPDTCWQAAHVDEDWQISNWGQDDEAAARRARRRAEFDGLVHFLTLLEPA